MTEHEWLYIKQTHSLDISYKELMKFENRELAWRFAHIKSGMTLSRLQWELEQAAKIEAKLEKKRIQDERSQIIMDQASDKLTEIERKHAGRRHEG